MASEQCVKLVIKRLYKKLKQEKEAQEISHVLFLVIILEKVFEESYLIPSQTSY